MLSAERKYRSDCSLRHRDLGGMALVFEDGIKIPYRCPICRTHHVIAATCFHRRFATKQMPAHIGKRSCFDKMSKMYFLCILFLFQAKDRDDDQGPAGFPTAVPNHESPEVAKRSQITISSAPHVHQLHCNLLRSLDLWLKIMKPPLRDTTAASRVR